MYAFWQLILLDHLILPIQWEVIYCPGVFIESILGLISDVNMVSEPKAHQGKTKGEKREAGHDEDK